MARRMAASTTLSAPYKPGSFLRAVHATFRFLLIIGALIALAVMYTQVDHFLVGDSRLVLPGPPEPGVASDYFKVTGTHFSSEDQVTAAFAKDFGRSIYLCPIYERRRMLLGIPWVKDATILRIWPNRLNVHITERTPVAFLQLPSANNAVTYSLIDSEGVVLEPQRAVRLALPVVSGIAPREKQEIRKKKVERFLRLQAELGSRMDKISEVDMTDIDDLRIKQVMDGQQLTLLIGNQKFSERMQNLMDNYASIRERLGGATTLNLRHTGIITAPGAERPPSASTP